MITYIYTLADENGVRYIGKSDNPHKRYADHIKESKYKRTRKEKWIFSLLDIEQRPVLEILDEVPVDSWEFYEKYWISQFRAWGFSIVNGTDGGEGSNGFKGKTHSNATKEKLRLAALKNPTNTKFFGSSNGRSKLTEQQVNEIKLNADKKSRAKLAKEYNVSKTTICWIISGRRRNIAG